MNRSILAVAVASLLPSAYSLAQEVSVDETMVILARSENVNTIADIPSNVVVISRDEIEQSGAKSLEALLRGRAGIQVSDSNSGPAFSIRGFSGEQASSNTLVMLDGRRLNSQDLVAPNLSFVQLDDVESIEILSGSAGVLYGDQAVGGVINIVTRSSKESRVGVSTSYGSFNSSVQNISASGPINDEFSYRFSATQNNSDNYRDHNASKNGSVLGRVDYQDDSKQLFVELAYYDVEREYAGSLTKEQFEDDPTQVNQWNTEDFSHEITRAARLGYHQYLNSNWLLKNEILVDDAGSRGKAWGSSTETESGQLYYTGQLEGSIAVANGSSNLLFGVDAAKTHYDYTSSFTERDSEQKKLDVYGQYTYPLLDKLRLTAGARYAKVSDDLTDKALYPNGESISDDATAYELALNYQLSDKARLYARTESNFRFAKVSEQSYTPPGVVGLKPQTGLSNELGWHWNEEAYSLRVDAFHLKLEDEIVFVNDASLTPVGGAFQGANVNADSSTRYGAILSGEYFLSEDVSLFAEYSYVDAEFTDGPNKGKEVSWVAKHSGKVGFGYYITESLDLYTDAIYTGERYQNGDNGNELDKLDSYWLVNLAVNYTYADLTVTMRTDNLFNEKYASAVFYDGYSSGYYSGNERAYYLTASYQF
ncbi:TonB-dependent receptor [Vibrio sinaloensis DSM 21326]|uniref:TonB-dependent receptor n=1 Tax=Vibrio sinaloensis DSM 21326 TaxID=945550 RepID=E8M9V0_PHOS4|nr:TonB-dependent receptor [Vibrio sinaloensis]EGA69207.1 TonB-dependent receptor [Vibrio sinaloensis DSM 21326]